MDEGEKLGVIAVLAIIIVCLFFVISMLSFNIGKASGERDTMNRLLIKQNKLYPEAYDTTVDQDAVKKLQGVK